MQHRRAHPAQTQPVEPEDMPIYGSTEKRAWRTRLAASTIFLGKADTETGPNRCHGLALPNGRLLRFAVLNAVLHGSGAVVAKACCRFIAATRLRRC